MEKDNNKVRIDWSIFIPCIIVLLVLCVAIIMNFERCQEVVSGVLTFIQYKCGWLYIIVTLATTCFALYLGFGKYKNVRMCAQGEKPAYSLPSWFAMLFFTTMASSIMIMPFINAMKFIDNPFMGMTAGSSEAYEWATTVSMFLYGPHGYSSYVIFAVGVAFVVHYKKSDKFKVSEVCAPVIGERNANGKLGKVIDVMVLFGVLGGVCTSFGLAVPVVLNGFCALTGMEQSTGLMVAVLLAWTCVFGISVTLGVDKGIKRLSNFNAIMVFVFVFAILIFGPTLFIIKNGMNSFGLMLQNYPRLLFWTDPIEQTGYVEANHIFYYAWFIGFATTTGTFLGKISKGRSVREIVFGSTLAISLCCWIIIAVFGSFSVNLQANGIMDISAVLNELGQNATVIQIVSHLPVLGKLAVVLHTLLLFTFIATTLDSTALNLASMTSVKITGDQEPALANKFFWVFTILILTGFLMVIGGLSVVNVCTTVCSLPMIAVMIIVMMSVIKMFKREFAVDKKEGKDALEE